MAKKKLLNEATVRRFMGLAGMESSLVSNKINEMGMGKSYKKHYGDEKMEEGSYNMEEDQMEEGSYNMEEDLYEEEEEDMDDMGDDADLNLDQDKAREIVDAYDTLGELVNDIKASMDDMGGEEGEEGEEGDEDMEAMADMGAGAEDADLDAAGDDAGDDEDDAEMLEGIELQLSEDEIVQEVARRVAKRILRAKRAKAQLDEALGRTKRR